ncbi:hypothetical protein EC991_007629 [Linnemannia zychae]|nr:hypothetical protein EC991_007629 [Linnemannia zychae]
MNQLAESTIATINSLKAYTLLSKALANDPKPTPGYLFPEITRLTQSSGTCTAVLSQLLKVITASGHSTSTTASTFIRQNNSAIPGSGTGIAPGQSLSSSAYASSPHVILKALKILRQLAQSGSVEFRIQLARQGKGPLSEVVGYRGSWDEIHGDRLNEDIRTIAEDLIEYMHSNPVQDHEILEARQTLTAREAAVMQNSTQGLPGYGNPEYEDSESDEDIQRSKSVLKETSSKAKAKPRKKSEKKREDAVSPPLPGFGNPEFEQQNSQSEPTLMGKLFDRIQDLTAPPPPMAMRAAYRQQEQRRQKLLAQHIQTNYIRTQQQLPASLTAGENISHLAVWGVAGEVCAVVVEGIRQDTLISVEEPQVLGTDGEEGTDLASTQPAIPVMTGILRDMVDWIEQETWERRLLAKYIDNELRRPHRMSTLTPKDPLAQAITLPDVTLLDIGA